MPALCTRKKLLLPLCSFVASFLLIPPFLSGSLSFHLSLTPGDSNVWMNRYLSVPLFPEISKHLKKKKKKAMTVKGIQISESEKGILSLLAKAIAGTSSRGKSLLVLSHVAKAGVSWILRHKLHSGRSLGVKRY